MSSNNDTPRRPRHELLKSAMKIISSEMSNVTDRNLFPLIESLENQLDGAAAENDKLKMELRELEEKMKETKSFENQLDAQAAENVKLKMELRGLKEELKVTMEYMSKKDEEMQILLEKNEKEKKILSRKNYTVYLLAVVTTVAVTAITMIKRHHREQL